MKTDDSSPNNVVPLRTVLQNFLNVVESYESRRNCGIDAYEKEFQELKVFSENLKTDPDYQCKEGEKNVNRKKNRYKDILPFDYTRVTLTPQDDIPGSDYTNANFIKGASGSSAYIACQGPLSHTVNDFWRMVVECEVQVIVMACMEQESGKHKCEKYWVDVDDVEKQFGQVTVWLKKCRNVCPDFLVRTMRIKFTNIRGETEERNVCQFHYSAWPDHGIPNRVRPLLDMVRLIRDCQTSETLPVLIHCSAGCGRTGTICAIDYVWGLLRFGKLTADFSLFQLVKEMRRQRIAMVQTKDQYVLVHRAVKELFQEQLIIIDAHIYANLDQNGFPFRLKQDLEEPTYETIEFDNNIRSQQSVPSSNEHTRDESFKNNNIGSADRIPNTAHGSKLKDKLENLMQLDQYNYNQGTSSVRLKKSDVVTNSLSSSDELSESEKSDGVTNEGKNAGSENLVTKVEPTTVITASSSKSSLLRKPSIIKLKAFFERSPKEGKEKKTTQLSRAKSDVSSSSRFYSFASSFGGPKRSNSPLTPAMSSKPVLDLSPSHLKVESNSLDKEKLKKSSGSKPPLFAKPNLPIKRSKSLKLNPDSSNDTSINGEYSKSSSSNVILPLSKSGSSSSGGFTSQVTSKPIIVCVKQVETPKLQSIVSSSVKPEVFTASSTHSSEEKNLQIDTAYGSTCANEFAPMKPSAPTVVDFRKLCPNYVNVGYGGNKIKIGVAKEMEDISYGHPSRYRNNKSSKKKYDTVNSRTMGSLSSGETHGTLLTRSQSHVWEHEKLKLVDRIFSDDNLCKSGQSFSCNIDPIEKIPLADANYSWKSNAPVMKVKPLKAGRSHIGVESFNSDMSRLSQPKSLVFSPAEKPAVRHIVPKTNPYTNYPLTGSDRYSPLLKKTEESTSAQNVSGSQSRFKDYTSQLKSHNHSTTIGNSSESSNSNTGTPRNSLPGTPTQSIDGLYSQHLKSNAILNSSSILPTHLVKDADGINTAPKSILKGSLSSSSESDDRVDNANAKLISSKPRTSPLYSATNSILGANTGGSSVPTPNINSIRTPLGVRERRNSFRQAVWKEAQNNGQLYHSSQTPLQPLTQSHTFPPIYASAGSISATRPSFATNSTGPAVRSHKDYEPIWPDGEKNIPIHISSTYVSKDGFGNLSNSTNHNGSSQLYYHRNNDSLKYDSSISKPTPVDQTGNYGDTQFQSKLNEIKVLLEGLNTPPPTLANSSISRVPKGSLLKHQRSLKSTSRSQSQQQNQEGGGVSCFSFKRTNSFESISDPFQSTNEEYQPLVSSKSPFTFFSDAQPLSRESGQKVNDYVMLGRSKAVGNSTGGFDSNSEQKYNSNQNESNTAETTPIPPPRTKSKKNFVYETKDTVDCSAVSRWESGKPNLSVWTDSDQDLQGSPASRAAHLNKPAIHMDDEGIEQQHYRNNNNGNIAGSSPKSFSRALGAFQAKAASVRSKFANWSEPKERGHSFKSQSNGETQLDDDGFTLPAHLSSPSITLTSKLSSGQPRTTKHQYL